MNQLGGPGAPGLGYAPPGWYVDPWATGQLRWWDGTAWQYHTHPQPAAGAPPPTHLRPWRMFLGPWLFIAALAPWVALLILGLGAQHPLVLPLSVVPTVVLAAAIWWIDRIEPEPFDALALAVAWGAVVAVAVAGVVNELVGAVGGEVLAAVVSAPLVEEAAKGAVLILLLRRRCISSPIDGVVYAIAVAAGFAVVEDILYFAMAGDAGGLSGLAQVFVVRGLLTPFAHPLFTMVMGLAAGWLVLRRVSTSTAVVLAGCSYLGSVFLHASWNGAMALAEPYPTVSLFIGGLFVVLFVAAVVIVVVLRSQQARNFTQSVPVVASLVGLEPAEIAMFADTRAYLAQRRALRGSQRHALAGLRRCLHRLAVLRQVTPRTATEAVADAGELDHLRHQAVAHRAVLRR